MNNSWLVANAIYKYEGNKNIWIKVANVTDRKIHINKNCQIAKIEFVEAVHVQNATVDTLEIENEITDFNTCGGKFDLDHLSKAQKQLVMEVINKNKSIFAQSVKDLTGCNTANHRIYFTDDVPVCSKSYRTLYALRQELKQQIDEADRLMNYKQLF